MRSEQTGRGASRGVGWPPMTKAREPAKTVACVDDYCAHDRSVFTTVRHVEQVTHLELGLLAPDEAQILAPRGDEGEGGPPSRCTTSSPRRNGRWRRYERCGGASARVEQIAAAIMAAMRWNGTKRDGLGRTGTDWDGLGLIGPWFCPLCCPLFYRAILPLLERVSKAWDMAINTDILSVSKTAGCRFDSRPTRPHKSKSMGIVSSVTPAQWVCFDPHLTSLGATPIAT